MKLSSAEQEQIIALLARIYFDIAQIETEFQLLVGEGDSRPRIEYFHDAIRALTSNEPVGMTGASRLNVEWLAYDLRCLRYLQAMPLSPFTPHQELSPHTDLVKVAPNSLAVKAARPDRATKERLVELYQHYAILFSALLKPYADNDCRERTEAAREDMQSIDVLLQQFGKSNVAAIVETIRHIEDDGLRQELQVFMESGKHKKAPEVKRLITQLKTQSKKKNKDIAGVEAATMDYALAQLGIYEECKDAVKKMASKGMNLVGKFVENAIAETRREMGR